MKSQAVSGKIVKTIAQELNNDFEVMTREVDLTKKKTLQAIELNLFSPKSVAKRGKRIIVKETPNKAEEVKAIAPAKAAKQVTPIAKPDAPATTTLTRKLQSEIKKNNSEIKKKRRANC